MKLTKKLWLKIGAAIVAIIVLIGGLLNVPQPFFHTSISAKNLTLYSDQAFTTESGQRVLELAEAKLARSPLYSAAQKHLIFICNARWRQRLFFAHNYGVGGVNYYPFTTNVFLRDSIIEENCMIGPNGNRLAADRPLDYFIAHEITHTLTGQAMGAIAYHRLPQWKREGYADYVGKGAAFNYDEAKRAFLANDPKMDYRQSGLYWRFHLLVAHLLEKKHWSVQQMLTDSLEQAAVEEMIRAEKESSGSDEPSIQREQRVK
ncbi:MAG TPA: hypothetical protein VFZ34_20185 [Blastocatellia bacterium]|nr:hypothetical protein [Blastocatellia bacterium]